MRLLSLLVRVYKKDRDTISRGQSVEGRSGVYDIHARDDGESCNSESKKGGRTNGKGIDCTDDEDGVVGEGSAAGTK